MTKVTTVANYSISELTVVVIYGLGAFVLYIVALLAITAWELRQAKQAQAITSVVPYIMKIFLYAFGWFLSVSLVFIILISLMPGQGQNPCEGIYGFWYIDWLNPLVWQSVGTGSPMTEQQLTSAQFMVSMMMGVKLVYHVMLIVFFFMIFSFAYSLTSLKMKQGNEDMSLALAGNVFLAFVASAVVYEILIGVLSIQLTMLLDIADGMGKVKSKYPSSEIDILYDITEFVRIGIAEWDSNS